MRNPVRVQHLGQHLTLRELAAATGINPSTIMKRWTEGERGERLIRPIDPRAIRNPLARKESSSCLVSSLLAGWKLAHGVFDLQIVTSPSARSS